MNEIMTINGADLQVREYHGVRVVTLKDIDTVHQRPDGTARKRFNDNKAHFIEGTDYFVRNSDEAKREFGMVAPNGLTMVTESGYLMIIKSFTDDLSWAVQRELVNCYFRVKQGKASTPKAKQEVSLSSVNNMASIFGKALAQAGVDPVQKVLAYQQIYRKAGFDLDMNFFPAEKRFYFLEDMAKKLGMMSKAGLPHAQAVGALVRTLPVREGEKQTVYFERNGHSDACDKYSDSVLDMAREWLQENCYPPVIFGNGKNYNVRYKH